MTAQGDAVPDREPIEDLVERSSFGTAAARAARAEVSDTKAQELLLRVRPRYITLQDELAGLTPVDHVPPRLAEAIDDVLRKAP